MAQYMVLLYGNEQRWDSMSPDEAQQIDDGHRAFRAKAGAAILASGELEPTTVAVTVRAGSNGHFLVSDGPFLETKESRGRLLPGRSVRSQRGDLVRERPGRGHP
jgi:hypothetical protein